MKYEVNIVYKGQVNYIVEADSEEQASDKAIGLYTDDSPGDHVGTEWEGAIFTNTRQLTFQQHTCKQD